MDNSFKNTESVLLWLELKKPYETATDQQDGQK